MKVGGWAVSVLIDGSPPQAKLGIDWDSALGIDRDSTLKPPRDRLGQYIKAN